MFTTVHKHYTVEEWKAFAAENPDVLKVLPVLPLSSTAIQIKGFLPQNVAVSSGSGEDDYTKLCKIIETVPNIKYICLDVANGYSEHFVSFVRQARKEFPSHTIMVQQRVNVVWSSASGSWCSCS